MRRFEHVYVDGHWAAAYVDDNGDLHLRLWCETEREARELADQWQAIHELSQATRCTSPTFCDGTPNDCHHCAFAS